MNPFAFLLSCLVVFGTISLVQCNSRGNKIPPRQQPISIEKPDDMAAFTDSVIKASKHRLDSVMYYFIRNHETYRIALDYQIDDGNWRMAKKYGDSCNYYNNLLQKMAHK